MREFTFSRSFILPRWKTVRRVFVCFSCEWTIFFFLGLRLPSSPCLLANLDVCMTVSGSLISVVFYHLLRITYSCHCCRVLAPSFALSPFEFYAYTHLVHFSCQLCFMFLFVLCINIITRPPQVLRQCVILSCE